MGVKGEASAGAGGARGTDETQILTAAVERADWRRMRRSAGARARTCEMCRRSASSGGGTKGVHFLGSHFRPKKAIVSGACVAEMRECK
jgi:hypothetical protein